MAHSAILFVCNGLERHILLVGWLSISTLCRNTAKCEQLVRDGSMRLTLDVTAMELNFTGTPSHGCRLIVTFDLPPSNPFTIHNIQYTIDNSLTHCPKNYYDFRERKRKIKLTHNILVAGHQWCSCNILHELCFCMPIKRLA
jgi:hypothetical protein